MRRTCPCTVQQHTIGSLRDRCSHLRGAYCNAQRSPSNYMRGGRGGAGPSGRRNCDFTPARTPPQPSTRQRSYSMELLYIGCTVYVWNLRSARCMTCWLLVAAMCGPRVPVILIVRGQFLDWELDSDGSWPASSTSHGQCVC